MASLNVKLLSPDKTMAEVDAQGVTVPGVLGYMTVLPAHASMVSELDVGKVTIDYGSKSEEYFVAGGYVEVNDDKLIVLADVVETPEAIDIKRAEEAKSRAEKRLGDSDPQVDSSRAQKALKRAEYRITIARTLGAVAHGH